MCEHCATVLSDAKSKITTQVVDATHRHQVIKYLRRALGRALLPACLYQLFVAGYQLRQGVMLPLG